MKKLAINGAKSFVKNKFPNQNTIGKAELQYAVNCLLYNRLSGYQGNAGKNFYGGTWIQELIEVIKRQTEMPYVVPCNSATSGLHIACGALQLRPGDEVIVTPYSMTCSATAPIIFGATPVFADIDPDTFCLDPESVESKITENTRAIIAVSLFGQPYDSKIVEIAREHDIFLIDDAAQSLGSYYNHMHKDKIIDRLGVGHHADMTILSFNYGKHLTCGEGGAILMHNLNLFESCQLMMNHAEAVINDDDSTLDRYNTPFELDDYVGFNMRMSELSAAVLCGQFEQLVNFVDVRRKNANRLNNYLSQIPAIQIPKVSEGNYHSYYALGYKWNRAKADGLHRDKFINAVRAELQPREGRENEGILLGNGYIKPLYLMPLFQYSTLPALENKDLYKEGTCPVCERLWKEEVFVTIYHAPNSGVEDMDLLGQAFLHVWNNRKELL